MVVYLKLSFDNLEEETYHICSVEWLFQGTHLVQQTPSSLYRDKCKLYTSHLVYTILIYSSSIVEQDSLLK